MRYIYAGFLVITAVLHMVDLPVDIEEKNSSHSFYKVHSLYPDSGMEPVYSSSRVQENSPPVVRILSPGPEEIITWNSQVRYEISVSDQEDGESRYGEINPDEVLLEVEYLPEMDEQSKKKKLKETGARQEPLGLSLIKTSTCFGCHREQTRLVGPSFSEIARRYEPDSSTIANMGTHIVEGSSGRWGTAAMPANSNLSQEEAMKIARFILKQGANERRSIHPGLSGIFRVMEKPADNFPAAILLTASYMDHGLEGKPNSRKRGVSSVIIDLP